MKKECSTKKEVMKGLNIVYDEATGWEWIKIDPASAEESIQEGWAMLPYNWEDRFRKWVCGCKIHEEI